MRLFLFLAAQLAVFNLIILCPEVRAQALGRSDTGRTINRSIDGALDSEVPKKSSSARMRSKFVLFVTDRSIDPSADQQGRNGKILRYERLLLNTLGRPVSYGFAEIGYPTTRKAGDTNYAPCSKEENPLKDFSIIDHQIVSTPEAFQELIHRYYPTGSNTSLLFFHGLNNSFSDAAERLAQLVLDLDYVGLPVLFSWPSDAGRSDPCWPSSGIGATEYKKASEMALASQPYAVHTMDLLAYALRPFEVLAHSMGADLATNSVIFRQSTKDEGFRPYDPTEAIAASPCSLVLAAPDISTKQFNVERRPKIIRRDRHVAVYCSNDRALQASQITNSSDERLGYCPMAKSPMEGIDLVAVTGKIQDFFHHSYYLNSGKILEDIRHVLDCSDTPSNRAGGQREIRLP